MKKKIPFSKLVVAYVMVLCTLFLVFVCYEMHRLCDLTAIAYIGAGVIGLMATALACYVWRAKRSDDYEIALMKAQKEKELGLSIETDRNIM